MRTWTYESPQQHRLRSIAHGAVAVLVLAALALALLLWRAAYDGPSVTAEAGKSTPLRTEPYGRQLTVLLPGSEITVTVGAAVDRLDHDLLDVNYDDPRFGDQQALAAPDDGALVPLTWSIRALGGFTRAADPNPVVVRLVAGDQRVDLASVVLGDTSDSLDALDPTSVAVAVDGRPDLGDLAVEVEYDGVTQVAHVDTGKVDAGVAKSLYEPRRSYSAGCTEVSDRCAFAAADPDSLQRPDSDDFTASYLSLYPYDTKLGWAAAGTSWAAVRLQLFGPDSAKDATGRYWRVAQQESPVVTLDGVEPVDRSGLTASDFDINGRVVFSVEDGTEPRELVLERTLTLKGPDAPPDLPTRATLDLTPVG